MSEERTLRKSSLDTLEMLELQRCLRLDVCFHPARVIGPSVSGFAAMKFRDGPQLLFCVPQTDDG